MQILNSEYKNYELLERIKGVNHAICFWHKFQNFIILFQQKVKNESIRKECNVMFLFKTLGSCQDREIVKKVMKS